MICEGKVACDFRQNISQIRAWMKWPTTVGIHGLLIVKKISAVLQWILTSDGKNVMSLNVQVCGLLV